MKAPPETDRTKNRHICTYAEAVGRVEAIPELALELMEERALDLAELAEERTEETAEPALLPA